MHDCWQAEAQKSWTSFASTRSGGKHGYGSEVEMQEWLLRTFVKSKRCL